MSTCVGDNCPDAGAAAPGADIDAAVAQMAAFELDPMDLPAAILYVVFNVILTAAPVTVFYTYVVPILASSNAKSTMHETAWYILWIGNVVLNGLPAVFGAFTWLWNPYVVIGYVAWSQYLVVWGGTIMQMINFVLFIAGAATYSGTGASNSADIPQTAWIEFAVWTVCTAGLYAGVWLLNDNFLSYYVLEEIIHGINPDSVADAYKQLSPYEAFKNR